MPRLFLYLIIVLFPNQNIIAKVAEKAKRVAVTDQTISNVFLWKKFFALAFSLFNHCSFSESKYNCKSCGKGQARSCNRPDDKQCFFVKKVFCPLIFFFRKISLRYLPVVLLQEWIRSWWFALMVSLWLEGAGWRWLLMNVGWDFAKSRISWKPTKSRFFKNSQSPGFLKTAKSCLPCVLQLVVCVAAYAVCVCV